MAEEMNNEIRIEELQNEIKKLEAEKAELEAKLGDILYLPQEDMDEIIDDISDDADVSNIDECESDGYELPSRTRKVLQDIKENIARIKNELAPLAEKYKEKQAAAAQTIEGQISEHPLTSVCVAFGVGLLLAKLFSGERKDR